MATVLSGLKLLVSLSRAGPAWNMGKFPKSYRNKTVSYEISENICVSNGGLSDSNNGFSRICPVR